MRGHSREKVLLPQLLLLMAWSTCLKQQQPAEGQGPWAEGAGVPRSRQNLQWSLTGIKPNRNEFPICCKAPFG